MKRLISFNTIRRILPLGGCGILFLFAFVACTSDEDGNSDNRLPITFSCSEDGVTRAEVSLSEFISDFKVYGINGDISGSGNAATFTKKNTVFPDYQVWHTENQANTTSTNTANWEYVGTVEGVSGSEEQTIKYWDEKRDGHYFWAIGDFSKRGGYDYTESTLPDPHVIEVENITQVDVQDDSKCLYFTKPKYVPKSKYGQPVTLTFKSMAAKVRVALYETVPGYSVQDVEFYQDEATALTTNVSGNEATLYTPDGVDNQLPQSGTVTVIYPRIGSNNSGAADYNKASVSVSAGSTKSSTQTFGTLSGTIGTSLPSATFAGSAADDYYKAVIPNTNGKPLTLRVNYTLVSTDTFDIARGVKALNTANGVAADERSQLSILDANQITIHHAGEDRVQSWIDEYLYMNDSSFSGNGTGRCLNDNLYLTAKRALIALGNENVSKFQNNTGSLYTAALARYNAWASACGDTSPFAGNNIVPASRAFFNIDSNSAAIPAIVVVIALATVTTGAYFFLRKKKEN